MATAGVTGDGGTSRATAGPTGPSGTTGSTAGPAGASRTAATTREARPAAPLVAAIVVNWNGAAITRRCVESLLRDQGVDLRVLVVDNASQAEDRTELRRWCGDKPGVTLLELDENRHFAGGVNAGARQALELGASHLVFLNNDTELEPGCLREMVEASLADPRVGIVGPALLDLHSRNALSLGERYGLRTLAVPRTLLRVRRAGSGEPYPVGGVMGSVILVTARCFREAGPYREDLLFYHEEVDFCLRARRAGFQARIAPRAIALHDGLRGMTSGLTAYAGYLKARNPLLIARALARPLDWACLLPIHVAIVLLSAALHVARCQAAVAASLLRGLRDGLLGRAG